MNKAPLYGDVVSEFYDLLYPPTDVSHVVEYVRSRYPSGAKIVDFGVGTGRTAIPLAIAGNHVHGIDISERMIEALRDKDPERGVTTEVGDFTHAVGDGTYDMCMMMNNTFFMILGHEDRTQTLRAAYSFLKPGGRLVLETYAAHHYLRESSPITSITPLGAGDLLLLDKIDVDPIKQQLLALRSIVGRGNVATFVEISRFSLPQELDLLGRAAGFDITERSRNWQGDPVDAAALSHVSEYVRR
ncbi:class I SAM-dependent methyltransferase [Microbacterium profundi]|uniref:Class I SAM-dependent methyltransferase n=1 Tax=Microbacterium profundi TaxID=450380 RepID=A0ABV3LL11_9MICO